MMKNIVNQRSQNSHTGDNEVQVVVFRLAQEEYAADILSVQEIIRLLNITRVPRAEKYIEGVINLRGNIIPVLNLHSRFNIEESSDEEDKRIVVFQIDDIKAGIIVDEVSEVLHIKQDCIEDAALNNYSMNADYLKGVAKVDNRLILILDLQKVI